MYIIHDLVDLLFLPQHFLFNYECKIVDFTFFLNIIVYLAFIPVFNNLL